MSESAPTFIRSSPSTRYTVGLHPSSRETMTHTLPWADSAEVYEFATEKVDMPLMSENDYYQRYYANIQGGGKSATFPTGVRYVEVHTF